MSLYDYLKESREELKKQQEADDLRLKKLFEAPGDEPTAPPSAPGIPATTVVPSGGTGGLGGGGSDYVMPSGGDGGESGDAFGEPGDALAAWTNAGWDPEEAKKWIAAGFSDPMEAMKWKESNYSFEEASAWKKKGYSFEEAQLLKSEGKNVTDVETKKKVDDEIVSEPTPGEDVVGVLPVSIEVPESSKVEAAVMNMVEKIVEGIEMTLGNLVPEGPIDGKLDELVVECEALKASILEMITEKPDAVEDGNKIVVELDVAIKAVEIFLVEMQNGVFVGTSVEKLKEKVVKMMEASLEDINHVYEGLGTIVIPVGVDEKLPSLAKVASSFKVSVEVEKFIEAAKAELVQAGSKVVIDWESLRQNPEFFGLFEFNEEKIVGFFTDALKTVKIDPNKVSSVKVQTVTDKGCIVVSGESIFFVPTTSLKKE